jgi:penicillin-binding protein 2
MVVASRLLYLQVYRASHYRLLSDKNRISVSYILPTRGDVFDRNGVPLAINKASYSVVMDFSECDPNTVAEDMEYISKASSLDADTVININSVLCSEKPLKDSIVIQENLSWEDLSFWKTIVPEISGLQVKSDLFRFYPYSEMFCHVIGFTGAPDKSDIENAQNLLISLPTAKIGKSGVEKVYNEVLFGIAGVRQTEVNSTRTPVRILCEIPSTPGSDIYLTIDKNLQEKVYSVLSKYAGAACVVMNPNNGEILSMVSYPGFDPNIFSTRHNGSALMSVYNDPRSPMLNKISSGLYSPGSTFKMITAIAGLNSGVVDQHTKFNCSGYYQLGNRKFHCWAWKYSGHGYLNLRQSIERSCDVFFYNLARLVQIEDIAKVASDFGLGKKTGIDLPGEKSGLVPTKKWKRGAKKQAWTSGDSLNTSIGQGFLLSTPIQLATMLSIIVNGQKIITPHVVKKDKAIMDDIRSLSYKNKDIELVKQGMFDVVNGELGSARKHEIDDEEIDEYMAGKTGTSQVKGISKEQRKRGITVSDNYLEKEHGFFVGYFPADNPNFVICVFIEHGGSGVAAASVAKEIFTYIGKNFQQK